MRKGLRTYLLMGGGFTALFFWIHSFSCNYDMTPLCFFVCTSPLVLFAPLSIFDDDDWDK